MSMKPLKAVKPLPDGSTSSAARPLLKTLLLSMLLASPFALTALTALSMVSATPALSATSVLADAEAVPRNDELATMRSRFVELTLQENQAPLAEEAHDLLRNLGRRGSWPDVFYQDDNKSSWKAKEHMNRVITLALAWRSPDSALQGDPAVLEGALRAFRHWFERNLQPPSWWFEQIGMPFRVGVAMLLLDDELDASLRAQGLQTLAKAWPPPPKEQDGNKNQVDRAEIRFMQGLLGGDAAMPREAMDLVAAVLQPAAGEGVQADWSFHMHGPILYTGGYGAEFLLPVAELALVARGTAAALAPDRIAFLENYILDHMQWVVYDARFDASTVGRNLTRRHGVEAAFLAMPLAILRDLAQAEGRDTVAALEAFLERLHQPTPQADAALAGARMYWRSDYMVQRRPGVYASVKMLSTRTRANESGNGEGLRNNFLSDGAFFLQLDGDEYRGVYPVWDWERIPGITKELGTGFPEIRWGRGAEGERRFVGGVTDGTHGLAAMDFSRGELRARKAWFFFDGEIVALGAGVTCVSTKQVITSLAQRRLQGPITLMQAGQRVTLSEGRSRQAQLDWVHHDRVGYLLLDAPEALASAESRMGNWWRINRNLSQDPVTMEIMRLELDHGVAPRDAAYAYVTTPNVSLSAFEAYVASPSVRVIANTPALQAVAKPALGAAGAVFHEPGETTFPDLGMTLATADPCAIWVIRRDGEGGAPEAYALHVADPSQTLTQLTLTLGGRYVGEGARLDVVDGATSATRVTIPLPQGERAGAAVTVLLGRE